MAVLHLKIIPIIIHNCPAVLILVATLFEDIFQDKNNKNNVDKNGLYVVGVVKWN